MVIIEVFLELSIGQFITWLVLAVVFRVLLDSVIGKMDHSRVQITQTVFFTTSSQVSFLVEISFQTAVVTSN